MSYSTLTANTEALREMEPGQFISFSDSDLLAFRPSQIRDDIARDIEDGMQLSASITSDVLDALVVQYADDLSRAFTFKYLEEHFRANDSGEGSITRMKMIHYSKRYEGARARFKRFGMNTSSVNTVTLSR